MVGLARLTRTTSLWDSFRSQIPFLTIVDPAAVEEVIRSLIDTYAHLGWLPDCRMTLSKGYTQASIFAFQAYPGTYIIG